MANNSVVTQDKLQEFYNTKVYPYLNGSANLGFTPIGTVISVMSNEAPENYLVCDGTTYNISEYSDLANFFEDQFGSKNYFGGDGTTTFAVPDLRGEFLRGSGTNSHTNSVIGTAEGSGSNVGVHQQATSHRYYQVEFANGVFGFTNNTGDARDFDGQKFSGKMKYSTTFTNQTPDLPTGGNYPCYFTSRPTNTSVLYCIAYKNIYFQQMHDYSTNEHVVGTWIDGRNVYEKILTFNMPATSDMVNASLGFSLDNTISFSGTLINDNATNIQIPIPFSTTDSSLQAYECVFLLRGNNHPSLPNTLGYKAIGNNTRERPVIITMRYTKTTDTV